MPDMHVLIMMHTWHLCYTAPAWIDDGKELQAELHAYCAHAFLIYSMHECSHDAAMVHYVLGQVQAHAPVHKPW